ncbi:hypothetical protein BGZ80_004418 [Entomortierella chlamydospora]|uniref:Galactose oxidase n=1 Tax=Entomortierella chlamydospora TaxID=101097 RepID=A0A9P6MM45_9FUNG|nr:hypothetical protein BGZ80_004418 [Entomortierella chlamydospora]
MIVFSNGSVNIFNFQTEKWNKTFTINNFSLITGLTATTDPETNQVYIPNGVRTGLSTSAMLQIDTMADKATNVPMHPNLINIIGFSAAWSATQKSMFVFGGTVLASSTARSDLYSYSPKTGWSIVATTGQAPSGRILSCMLPVDGGAKIVLFGGIEVGTKGLTTLNDIYILDTTTNIWTRGQDTTSQNGRGAMACGISNDQFIAWGGTNDENLPVNSTIVYDINANTWKSEYTLPTTTSTSGTLPVSSTPPAGSSAEVTPESNSRIMIILGSAIGLVVLFVVVGSLVHRARAKHAARKIEGQPSIRPDAWISGPLDSTKTASGEAGPICRVAPWHPDFRCLRSCGRSSPPTQPPPPPPLQSPFPVHTSDSAKKWHDLEKGYDERRSSYEDSIIKVSVNNDYQVREEYQVPKPSTRYRQAIQARNDQKSRSCRTDSGVSGEQYYRQKPSARHSRPEKEKLYSTLTTDNILEVYSLSPSLPPVDHHGNPIQPPPVPPSNYKRNNTRPPRTYSYVDDENDIL